MGNFSFENLSNLQQAQARGQLIWQTGFSKTCTAIRKIGGARRNRIGFSFPKLYRGICRDDRRSDENEEQTTGHIGV